MSSDATKSHTFQQLFSIKILTKLYTVDKFKLKYINTVEWSPLVRRTALHMPTACIVGK